MKKMLLFSAIALLSLNLKAQTIEQSNSNIYVNVFINKNEDIRIESDLVDFDDVSKEVKKRISDHSFEIDKNVIYRVFADGTLKLGYIMDVERKMFDAYNQNAKRERYLLNSVEMEIDGPNWLKKLEGIKIDKVKG